MDFTPLADEIVAAEEYAERAVHPDDAETAHYHLLVLRLLARRITDAADTLESAIAATVPHRSTATLNGKILRPSSHSSWSWAGVDDRSVDAAGKADTKASTRSDWLRWLRDVRVVDETTGEVQSDFDKLLSVCSFSAGKARTFTRKHGGDPEDWFVSNRGRLRLVEVRK